LGDSVTNEEPRWHNAVQIPTDRGDLAEQLFWYLRFRLSAARALGRITDDGPAQPSRRRDTARQNGWTFNWRLVEAEGIGHSSRDMFASPIVRRLDNQSKYICLSGAATPPPRRHGDLLRVHPGEDRNGS
jgi:hypothetical protein